MTTMDELKHAFHIKLWILEVEQSQDDNKQEITQVDEVSRDIVNIFLVKPIELALVSSAYIHRVHKDFKWDVYKKIYDG